MSTKTKLKLMLDAGEVRRFHTNRVIKDRTVGQHTFNMLALADAYYRGMTPHQLMKAILYHDVHEGILGDIPWPTKQRHPEIHRLEDEVDQEYDLRVELPVDQAKILKLLDMLEFYIYLLDEQKLGNLNNLEEIARAYEIIMVPGLPEQWYDFVMSIKQEV